MDPDWMTNLTACVCFCMCCSCLTSLSDSLSLFLSVCLTLSMHDEPQDHRAHWPAQPCQSLTEGKCWPWTEAPHNHPRHTFQACLALSLPQIRPLADIVYFKYAPTYFLTYSPPLPSNQHSVDNWAPVLHFACLAHRRVSRPCLIRQTMTFNQGLANMMQHPSISAYNYG